MCHQTSNALICTSSVDKKVKGNKNLIEFITTLIELKIKPCVSSNIVPNRRQILSLVVKVTPLMADWLTNFFVQIYLMIDNEHQTINKQEQELNDDVIALFIISTLRFVSNLEFLLLYFSLLHRFNLENDLLIRDTENINTTIINRKSCICELY